MRCERYGRTFALIITDMDNLKSINDRNGHLAGSGMLREVGKAIASAVRRTDIVARFGGDEFLVLADQVTGETALLLAERIRASVESIEMEFNDRIIRTTTSVGVACYPQHGRDYQELFAEADRMMYKAKTGGKNRVELAKTEPKGK
jgi:diguanylate cyclase (GGDEF)-like protein